MRARTIGAATAVLAVGLLAVGTTSAFADDAPGGTASDATSSTPAPTSPSESTSTPASGSASTPAPEAVAPTSPASVADPSPSTASPASGSTSPAAETSPSPSSSATTPVTTPGPSDYYPKPRHDYPFSVTVTWYKAGGNVATGDIWPQTRTAISCGGISQKDGYTINNPKEARDFQALLDKGVLTGPADDAEFHPHDYTVTTLPDCVVVPPQPADQVKTVVTHDIVCTKDDQLYYTTTTTTTTPYVYDEATNTWILGTPVTATDTTKVAATSDQCPPVVTPPTTPTKPVSPVGPTPPATPTNNTPVPTHVNAALTAAVPSAQPVASSLAYTGSDSRTTMLEAGGALAAVLGGIALAVVGRRRRSL